MPSLLRCGRCLALASALWMLPPMIPQAWAAETVSIQPAVRLEFDLSPPREYRLFTSEDFSSWTPVGPRFFGLTGRVEQVYVLHGEPARFFRVADSPLRDLNPMIETLRTQYNVPALGCAVIKSNRVVALGLAGVRKHQRPVPVSINDKFHHGSITKSMTSTLAALLVEEGRITWTNTTAQIFPEFAAQMHPDWHKVTLEMLLAHRSGAQGYLNPGPIWTELTAHPGSPREQRVFMVEKLTVKPVDFPPGTKHQYSNAGYAVAGAMLEKAAGKDWEELMQEKLFRPLDMTTAGFGVAATPRYINQPWGHFSSNGQPVPGEVGPNSDFPPGVGPGDAVHCSLPDLLRYAEFHLEGARGQGRLLSRSSFAKLHTDVANQGYSLGWTSVIRAYANGLVLTHSGSNNQFYSQIWILPEKHLAIVAVANVGAPQGERATANLASQMIQDYP